MGFKLLILTPSNPFDNSNLRDMPQQLRREIPDLEIYHANSIGEAKGIIGDIDVAYGDVVPELFDRAKNLKWIACPQAGPKEGYYHEDLIKSEVVVTNTRGIYNDHISAHIMSYVLTFARGLHVYMRQQLDRSWTPGYETIHLLDSTAVIIGVGGIGGETARLCAELGITVIGIDARLKEAPKGVAELYRPDLMQEVLPRGDFIIVTVPESPSTRGMFAKEQFALMKNEAVFINVGRGATVILDDLVAALTMCEIGGAALDVFGIEPLPKGHALWSMRNVIITPHVASTGPHLEKRRVDLFIDNCIRFNEGKSLHNIVDKANWF